jgi:alpha-L-rhamnosidase
MTLSHAWTSALANAIPRHVLGVRVTTPGVGEFLIRPRTGTLTDATGTVPSLRGPIEVTVHRSSDAHTTEVTVAPNSRAVLEVEIGDARPADYRVTAPAPGGRGGWRSDRSPTSPERCCG